MGNKPRKTVQHLLAFLRLRKRTIVSYLPMLAAGVLMLLMGAAAQRAVWYPQTRPEQEVSGQALQSFQSIDLILNALLVGAAGAVLAIVLLLFVLQQKMQSMRHSEALLERQNLELESSRRLLLEAQRIGRLGHWFTDDATQTAIWSPQVFEIAGIAPTEAVSFETSVSLIHPDDLSGFLRLLNEARSNRRPVTHELRWIRPDGSVRWVRVDSDPQFGVNAQNSGTFGIVQDITERKDAERAAEESKNRLVDAIESISQGFILYDNEDRFVLANSRFREMFPDLGRILVPGMRYEEVLRAGRQLGQNFAGGKSLERLYDNGRWIKFSDHRTSDGGTAGLRTDITEAKHAQAALERRLNDLERIRSDLEAQKQELVATSQDLVKAKDAAEAASRAKSDFLAIMSHEIRTPLSGMVGMIELLRDTPLTAEQKSYTKLARESSDNLLNVVNNILDFSKLEAGRISPELIDFDVVQLVHGVAMLLTSKALDKGLDLVVSIEPDVPQWLNGDPTRIRQILLNLVNNAIKFTPTGRVTILVAHKNLPNGHLELRVEVIDTGIGIDQEKQMQLFNPFVQADTSISRKYGGSGLGLAICKQLCSMMGGDIGLESGVEKGSKFWFTLTCSVGKPGTVEVPMPVSDADRSIEILVAEDSPIIAKLISTLLTKQGFDPDVVVNGAEAVRAVTNKAYDLVLMDVNMPEVDGISATRIIRDLPGPERTVPIIALTANALVGQRENYLAAGMNDYVTKPIQPNILFEAIRRWGGQQQALRSHHISSPTLQPLDMENPANGVAEYVAEAK